MTFLDDDYLLETEAARHLYDEIADLPIVDPHNHADVVEIVENDGWDDIWEVEGATDHYVWACMRKRGVSEELITGDASNREKFDALAEIAPELAGNPVYEWLHLDLKRRFGIDAPLSADTADHVWTETKAQLDDPDMRPQPLLREMGVEVLCSTDDPTDSLEYHARAVEEVEGVDVRPTWRADRAIAIDDDGWNAFVEDLGDATGVDTDTFEGYLDALDASQDHFVEHGCVACDVGMHEPVSSDVDDARAKDIFDRRRAGETLDADASDARAIDAGPLDQAAVDDYRAYVLEYIGERNAARDWTTQFHLGPVRNYRDELYEQLGPASGGTVTTGDVEYAENLRYFLNRFDGDLDVVLYAVDPTHYPTLATISRAFPSVSVGPAWWFNDSPFGIESQLEYVGTVDLLANHAGMVSDSRKLLSYDSRFEVFRRSLANAVGRLVDRGQVPQAVATDLVTHLAYDRPKDLYGF